MGAFPFFSIVLPQQGQHGASFAAILPGTVRICTAFLHLLDNVPNSLVRALSWGFPVCTKPSRWEGIRKKTESSSGMGNGGQLGCRGCYTCHRVPSLFGVCMLRCKILEDGRFSVSLSIKPWASAHSF